MPKRSSDDSERSRKKRKKEKKSHVNIVDDDDEEMWVEKNIDLDGERVLATDIPTAESLKVNSNATGSQREAWMLQPEESLTEEYGEPSQNARTMSGGVDFFSSLGTEVKKPRPDKPDPDKPTISSRELNPEIRDGRPPPPNDEPPPAALPNTPTPGGPGSAWRMTRLQRVYETAEEEGRSVEEIGADRFGSVEAFQAAVEERRILDERESRRGDRGSGRRERDTDGERRFMFNDVQSGPPSRASSFRRPGASADRDSGPSTPSPPMPVNRRVDSLRLPSQAASPLQQAHTPIPSVMTPQASGSKTKRALSPSSLNKLQAKVLRAKLMGSPDADELEREYEAAAGITDDGPRGQKVQTRVEVLPTLDGRGRLYDVGHGKLDDKAHPGNHKKKEKVETRDPKTGDIVRYNADDDTNTLGELLRQELFGGGISDQKDLDAQFARAIMGDGKFENDLEYIDDNAEKLGRQKMRSDAMKRQFAINDYKRTQQALANCHFCFGEDDSPPRAPVVAMGTRVFLSCTTNEELVNGHCLIVPIQHHLNMLEADDDVWDEVRNFMKCLMKMHAEEDKGVVFFETVISLKWQKHTFVECVPVPWDQFDLLPAYFKESLLQSEAEWSQHKKAIDFSARPGGFRRAMVPNLPYFMVQFDHKGEKGYGHVIEGAGSREQEEEDGGDDADKGADFPRYFAGEIIGNLLDVEPRRWRNPKRVDFRLNKERVSQFRKKYQKFDWTGMIENSK